MDLLKEMEERALIRIENNKVFNCSGIGEEITVELKEIQELIK